MTPAETNPPVSTSPKNKSRKTISAETAVPQTAAEMHARLDEIERRLGRLRADGRPAAAHQRAGAAIEQSAQALREKLDRARGPRWGKVKHELQVEWAALMHSLDRWTADIDRSFRID